MGNPQRQEVKWFSFWQRRYFFVGIHFVMPLLGFAAPNPDSVNQGRRAARGGRLQPSSQGARVHYAKGKFTVIDGPFAETKELIAGFCMIEAKSREEAIEWAKRIPFQEGEVEVRPLFELTDFPVDPAEKPDGWREKEEQFRAAPPARKPGTIRYMGILKADKDTEAGVLPDEKFLAAMGAFMEEGVKAGVFLSGEGLQPSSKGARVRYSGSKRMVTDGPFAETKELIAGYAILQFTSKAEAIEWTKRFVQVDAPGRLGARERVRDPPLLRISTQSSRKRKKFFEYPIRRRSVSRCWSWGSSAKSSRSI